MAILYTANPRVIARPKYTTTAADFTTLLRRGAEATIQGKINPQTGAPVAIKVPSVLRIFRSQH